MCVVCGMHILCSFQLQPFFIILILSRYHQILLLMIFEYFFQRSSMFFSVIHFHYAMEYLFSLFTLEAFFFHYSPDILVWTIQLALIIANIFVIQLLCKMVEWTLSVFI